MSRLNREVRERVERLELGFNRDGFDAYGISRRHLSMGFTAMGWLYRYYFRVRARGIEHVPARGRAMLVCNHAGGIPVDAGMLIAACFFELDPPRLAHGMADRFVNRLPIASTWTMRTGQITGLPEHAARLLEDERLLLIFPEGVRGTAKLFHERYDLVRFGTGFLRLALKHRAPIVPVGCVGGGAIVPTVANLTRVGRMFGIPYLPITPYGVPLPLPLRLRLRFGRPLRFDGSGNEPDATVEAHVERVKQAILDLVREEREAGPS